MAGLTLAAAALGVAAACVAGCRRSESPAPSPRGPTQVGPGGALTAPTASAAPAAGSASPPGPKEVVPSLAPPAPIDLDRFVGLSRDGARLAYAVWSDGAGFHIVQVVDTATHKDVTRFPLADDAARGSARAYLESHGFAAVVPAPPSAGAPVAATVAKGVVHAELRGPSGEPFIVEAPSPFGGDGSAPRVSLAGTSADGRFAVVRLEQDSGTEFGKAVAYVAQRVGPRR